MHNHAPNDYNCPFCRIVRESAVSGNPDFVFQDSTVTAFVSLHDPPDNLGHVIIIPNIHYENIYDLPYPLAANIHACSRAVALAMKAAYHCDGISTRQNNEPAGGQDVWHYHVHIYPRYVGDNIPRLEIIVTQPEKRAEHATQLRVHFENWIASG
jgi:histidine triad (HIT) family protein